MRASLDALMSTSHKLLWKVLAHAPSDLRDEIRKHMETLEVAIRTGRECVVLAPAGPDAWHVGPPDDVRLVVGKPFGIRAAWLAFSGGRPPCKTLRPDAVHAESLVSRGVHETAANWAEHTAGSKTLAAAMRSTYIQGGSLLWRRGPVEVLTAYVIPVSTDLYGRDASADHVPIFTR